MANEQTTIDLYFKAQDQSLVVDPADGEFLAISRLSIDRGNRAVGDPLKYELIKTLGAAEFYAILGETASGPVSIGVLSDHLVRAFDIGPLRDRSGFNCMFVWRNAAGHVVEQHST